MMMENDVMHKDLVGIISLNIFISTTITTIYKGIQECTGVYKGMGGVHMCKSLQGYTGAYSIHNMTKVENT